jgi:hypothetical protein
MLLSEGIETTPVIAQGQRRLLFSKVQFNPGVARPCMFLDVGQSLLRRAVERQQARL